MMKEAFYGLRNCAGRFIAILRIHSATSTIVRLAASSTLLFAAVMKFIDVRSHLIGAEHPAASFMPLLIGFEAVLGIWLASGVWWSTANATASVTFLVFACVAWVSALRGTPGCGCFGRVSISPVVAGSIDVALSAALFATTLAKARSFPESRRSLVGAFMAPPKGREWIRCNTLCISLVGVFVISTVVFTFVARNSEVATIANVQSLTPSAEWIGKRFPLLDVVEEDYKLSNGDWCVIIFHHDCEQCQRLLLQLDRVAGERIALVEVPPLGIVDLPDGVLHVRLDQARNWFIATPRVIRLREGVVTSVASDL